MIGFWIGAAVLTAVALAFVLPPLLRRHGPGGPDPQAAELAVYRQRLGELREDRARGVLSASQFEAAKEELEAALAADLLPEPSPALKARRYPLTAACVALALPLLAFTLYEHLGARTETARALSAEREAEAQRGHLQAAIQGLESRLATDPTDGEGWRLLGRARLALGESAEAAAALGRAQALLGEDPELLLDSAQALAQTQDNRLEGAPAQLIERALSLSPEHPRALWMASLSAIEQGAREAAKRHLEHLASRVKPGTEAERIIKGQLAALQAATPGSDAPTPAAPTNSPARIAVAVSLDASLTERVSPEDTVFVFARAKEGPRMPLAVVRSRVKELPLSVVLDDSKAMTPALRLSRFSEVIVGARVTRTGDPVPQSGDFEGFAEGPVATASDRPVAVTISRSVP